MISDLQEESAILVTDSIVLVPWAYCNSHKQEGSDCWRNEGICVVEDSPLGFPSINTLIPACQICNVKDAS